jgi:hypothetical protein
VEAGVTEIEIVAVQGAGLPELPTHYDSAGGILEVPILPGENWSNGIDFDALVIVDLAEDLALANIDLLLPQKRWQTRPPRAPRDRARGPHRALISRDLVERRSIVCDPRAYISPDGSRLHITLTSDDEVDMSAALTSHCEVLVRAGRIAGFSVRLPQLRAKEHGRHRVGGG